MESKIMRALKIVLIFLLSCGITQHGSVDTEKVMESSVLGKTVKYSVYLPEGYDQNNRSYPILYLLHGFTGDHTDWVQFGELEYIANRAFETEVVTPMIIVTPDADDSWYVNNYDGSVRFEDFFIKEFMPKVESEYRVKSEKQFRAIAGLSMGGHGALIYAVKYPQLFTAVAALSASIRTNDEFKTLPQEQWTRMFAPTYGDNLPEGRITPHLSENSILSIVKEKSSADLSKLDYYLDCGDDDHLIVCNMRLHESLLKKKVPHEFRVRDGAHEWHYWRSALPEVLFFMSQKFHR